jgi:NAD+ kinase/solute carrier family 25 oxoglutarate transporter 11
MRHRRNVKGVFVFTSLPRIPQTILMSDGHGNIDSHIATLEEALDALKRERYSRDYSSLNTTNKSEERDEDKERALMSENELLLRVLRKVMLEKEFHFPFEEDDNEEEEGEDDNNNHAIGSFSPSKFLLQNQDGAIGTMRKNFSDEFATKRTKSQKLILTNTHRGGENERDEGKNNSLGEETTLSRKDVEVLERLLAKKVRINEEEEDAEEGRRRAASLRLSSSSATRRGEGGGGGGGVMGISSDVATHMNGGTKKVPFELLMCNDDGCELIAPKDRTIRVRQHGTPHSKFTWKEKPKNALIVKKPMDYKTDEMLPFVVKTLRGLDVNVWMEPEELERQKNNAALEFKEELKTWKKAESPSSTEDVAKEKMKNGSGGSFSYNYNSAAEYSSIIDFVVVLGGDGTFLWVSNLFPKSCPPVVAFALGSLGFLTVFKDSKIRETLKDVVAGDFCVSLRTRLIAHILDKDGEEKSKQSVLNEVVVDRGPSAILVELDVAVDGSPLTKVFADGIIVSTPTGSTAYGLAAGGSMVHPGVSAMCFTPVCPHSLSFRPLVLPDSVVLTVRVPEDARAAPWAAFDGKNHAELKRGETLVIRCAQYPIASVCRTSENMDWFRAMKDALLWNVRGHQRSSLLRADESNTKSSN